MPSLCKVFLAPAVLILSAANAIAQTAPDVGRQYSRYLLELHEPDLRVPRDTGEVYRALWLRSFHEPVSVRILSEGDKYFVITAQGSRRDSTELPANSWHTLHLRNAMRDFWATQPTPLPDGVVGLDGARWILEGRDSRQYHVVDWWSPQERAEGIEGGYRRLFLEILSLGSVCVAPDAVY